MRNMKTRQNAHKREAPKRRGVAPTSKTEPNSSGNNVEKKIKVGRYYFLAFKLRTARKQVFILDLLPNEGRKKGRDAKEASN